MAAAVAEGGSAAPLLSIGQVLAKLSGEFPALTSSKLRFLEVQGIVSPRRTSSGYRKFDPSDLQRLRLALTLQRDHYLPLSVIREHLDALDEGEAGDVPPVPESIHPTERTYSRTDLLQAAHASPQLFSDALGLGIISPAAAYDERTVTLLRLLVALESHGIHPRHVRTLRQSAEREVALIEAAMAPLLGREDARSRARANEIGPQLADRLDEVRAIFVRQALEKLLPDGS